MRFKVAARDSLLSQAQVKEVLDELREYYPEIVFDVTLLKTTGDIDLTTSLESLDRTDFFTKEIDQLVLSKQVDLGIHSAKDLPFPLPDGLELLAITEGVDPSDSLVFRENESLETLTQKAKVGVSSHRRIQALRNLREDLVGVSIRGNIQRRLSLLQEKQVDALIIAEAAIIRLNLQHLPRMKIPCDYPKLQGKLALVSSTDFTFKSYFQCIDEYTHAFEMMMQ